MRPCDQASYENAKEGVVANRRSQLLFPVLFALVVSILALAALSPIPGASASEHGRVVLSADGQATSTTIADAVSVKCVPSSIPFGSSTQCTAVVSGSSPSGKVQWASDTTGTFSSTSCTLSSGSCHVAYTPLSASTPVGISAAYGGDAKNSPASGSFTLDVSEAHTVTNVSCSPSAVTIGGNSTCTATVKGQAPTGVVTWASSVEGSFQPPTCVLSSGVCSTVYTQSSASTATITGVYSGDANNEGSSDTSSLNVLKSQTKTTVDCTPSSIFVGFSTSCLATVSGYSPTGLVSFFLSAGAGVFSPPNGECALSLGNCTVSLSGNSTGTITVSAAYPGDSNNKESSGRFTLHSIQAVFYYLDPLSPLVSSTCSNLGGTWDGSGVCTLEGNPSLGSSAYVLVRPGATLEVTGATMLSDSGVINITGGTLTNDGFISVTSSGRLVNSPYAGDCGFINNAGTLTNYGTVSNSCSLTNIDLIKNQGQAAIVAQGGSLFNRGTISNAAAGSIIDSADSRGALNNSGTISNSGAFDLYGAGNISVTGSSDYIGSFTNTGTLAMNSGSSLVVGRAGTGTFLEIRGGTFILPTGVTLSVGAGSELVVDAGASLSNQGELATQPGLVGSGGVIFNGGSITDGVTSLLSNYAGCSILNVAGSTLLNNGTVTNKGTISNAGVMGNGRTGDFSNTGTLANKGTLQNGGTFANDGGVITNNAGGSISNGPGGTISNDASGTIDNNSGGKIANSGVISTAGTLINDAGGVITNLAGGVINNKSGATFYNNPSGFVFNYGAITNSGAITSNGEFSNSGTLANSGDLTNSGDLANGATITNSGAITSNGVLTDDGTVSNSGSITSSGQMGITSVGSITNEGSVINSGKIDSNGTFVNGQAGTLTIRGPLDNQGIFYSCGGYLEGSFALAGNGAITCNAAQAVQAQVASGTVQTQSFGLTGMSMSMSGVNGSVVGISTASERGQPLGTGQVAFQPAGGVTPLYFDISLFGVTGGSVHLCIASSSVDTHTVIEYFSSGAWSFATGIIPKPGSDVCGDIPTSALSGSPVAVGDMAGAVTATTATSSSSVLATARSTSSITTLTLSNTTTYEGSTSRSSSNASGVQTTSVTESPTGAVPEFPYQASMVAVASMAVAGSYLLLRRRSSRGSGFRSG